MNKSETTYNLTVWNVYKNRRSLLASELNKIITASDFVLAQEFVSTLSETVPVDHHKQTHLHLKLPLSNTSAGTAIISKHKPILTDKKLSLTRELGFTTFKSLISSKFIIDNKEITLINVHALNFVSTDTYKKTFLYWLESIPTNEPVIFAGDFNTWNSKRYNFVKQTLEENGLVKINFKIKKFLDLDHVWTRGVTVTNAECDTTNKASDHSPMMITFSIH